MDLPNPGIEPGSPTLQADSLPVELPLGDARRGLDIPSVFFLMFIYLAVPDLCCMWVL